jgi:F-type H+-transporting ATPase subunit a
MSSAYHMENAAEAVEQSGVALEAHGEAAAQASEQVLELPSFLDFLGVDMHHHYFGCTLHEWLPVIMSCLVGLLIVVFSLWSTRRMEKIPRGFQAFVEIIVEGIHSFLGDILGRHTARHLPFLGTIFIYIILMNLWGLIPFMHSPTSSLNTTLALSIAVFVMFQYAGVREKGFKYFKHYVEPIYLAPLMLPLHIIGDLSRPVSLSVRLFGNLTGEDLTLALLVCLTPFIFGWIPVPIHMVMVIMALLFSTIQAVVFTMLASIYLSLAVEEHESD